MRYIFTCLLICLLLNASSKGSQIIDIMPQLSYARYCADSINNSPRALKIYKEIIDLLSQTENDSLQLVAETERIELLNRTGQQKELLEALKSGIPLAKELKDAERLCTLLTIKGFIYAQLGFQRSANDIINRANDQAAKIENEALKNLNLGQLTALRTMLTESSEEKVFYYKQANRYLMLVPKESPRYEQAQITGNSCYAAAFMQRQQTDSALYYLKKSISSIKPHSTFPGYYFAITSYAQLNYLTQNYEEAEKWLLTALKQAESTQNIHKQEKLLYSLYNGALGRGDQEQGNIYLLRYATLKEQLDRVSREHVRLIESELNETRNQLLSEAHKEQTPIVLILSGTTFLLSLTIGGLYIKRRMEASPMVIKQNDLPQETHNAVTAEEIHELNILAKQDDSSFLFRFKDCYPSFTAKINAMANPPLNSTELEICACTKLNFSTKDIALYRNYTVRSVENRKYRIRKKLMLDSEVDFVVWIAGVN